MGDQKKRPHPLNAPKGQRIIARGVDPNAFDLRRQSNIEHRTSNVELGTPSAANLYFNLAKIMSFFDESVNLRTHRKIWITAAAYSGLEAGLELHAP